ncbi:MAG: phosphate ABC transporter permease PstA [Acidobacteriota bacterium]|nr:phosphate ABC transporter permease PstA [Acidobacteriota bacterium]
MSTVISGLPPDPILERRQLIQLRASQTMARRTMTSRAVIAALVAGVVISLIPLGSVLISLVAKGARLISWHFLSSLPTLPSLLHLNAVGGIWNAIAATLVIDLLAGVLAVPVGVIVGLYLADTHTRPAHALRAIVETMTGMPSILLGVFAYEYLVTTMKSYSGVAAVAALSMLMVPVIAKAAELAFRSVPTTLREAALALGARESRVARQVVLPTALPGVVTGVLLAFARAVGETAPVLLVVGPTISTLFNANPLHPMTPMPLLIYGYSNSQYPSQRAAAWGVALTLVFLVVLLTTTSRVISSRMRRERRS